MTTSLANFLIWITANILCAESFTDENYNISHFNDRNVTVSFDCSGNRALEMFFSDSVSDVLKNLGDCEFDGMGNDSRFSWFWSTLDALCFGRGFLQDKSNNKNLKLMNKSEWTLIKGEEKMMVLVNPLSNRVDTIEEHFKGDWRLGQEIKQVVITKRFFQVSSNSYQAWFSN